MSELHWDAPEKPAELAENRLVSAILDGTFPIDSNLPPERELAARLGVTRPTLREVLQRLSRDGWLEIHHGRATRVRNFLEEGNLNLLAAVARHPEHLPPNFIPDLLFVRVLMAPAYTRLAMERSLTEVIRLLESLQHLPDTPAAYAEHDFRLHSRLAVLSGNPIFNLILNSFGDLYYDMALLYFELPDARHHSRSYYKKMMDSVLSNDHFTAEEVTRQVMRDSLEIWRKTALSLSSRED